jgi:hypothetical protein
MLERRLEEVWLKHQATLQNQPETKILLYLKFCNLRHSVLSIQQEKYSWVASRAITGRQKQPSFLWRPETVTATSGTGNFRIVWILI